MKKQLVTSLLAAASALIAFAPKAEAQLAPETVEIVSFDYGGSGCPGGSVGSTLTPDRRTLTLLFDAFASQAAPNLTPAEARKSCDLSIVLNFPRGWSFTIATADYRGFAELDSGVVGTQVSSYFFGGGTGPTLNTRIAGPFSDNYFRRDTLGITAQLWSPCQADAPLRIHTESRVSTLRNPNGSGLMTVDSLDFVVRQTYGLIWRRC